MSSLNLQDDTGLAHFKRPGEIDITHGQILYLEDVQVSFDGFRALRGLSLMVADNELRCVIGPNGAGKTTMMDVITGKTRPDKGTVFLGQTLDLTKMDEPAIAQAGVGRKFQKPTVFENHTVWQNLDLARATDKRWFRSLIARTDADAVLAIEHTLERTALSDVAYRPAGELSHGQKQRLEIGMLLMQEPELMMLDEPVAGMSVSERERTAELLNRISRNRSLIVIEHDMEFVKNIAHKVTVLHQGRVLAEGSMDMVQSDPRVVEVYLGH